MFSDNFSDELLAGTTSGKILTRGDRTWSVSDEPDDLTTPNDSEGLRIVVGAGNDRASVRGLGQCTPVGVQCNISPLGADFVLTCGSTIVQVDEGEVEVVVTVDSLTITAIVGAGGGVTFDQPDAQTVDITNIGTTTVQLTINGEPTTLGVGETLLIEPNALPVTLGELIDLIDDLELPSNVENNLKAPLKNAQVKLNDDNPKNDGAACEKMNAFINMVNAQEGKKLTSEQAEELREAAQSVKDSIGC